MWMAASAWEECAPRVHVVQAGDRPGARIHHRIAIARQEFRRGAYQPERSLISLRSMR